MAGTGADNQVFSVGSQMTARKMVVILRQRDVPSGRSCLQAQWFEEARQAVADMLLWRRCNAPVNKQAVKVFAAGLVVADFDPGRDQCCSQVGPQCYLHMQKRIKPASFHLFAQVRIALAAGFLVEDDELNTRQITDEPGFDLANDPGDFHARELCLQAEDNRDDVSDIADGG